VEGADNLVVEKWSQKISEVIKRHIGS
jgi:hypothetical protein